jgi:hypothetical protein
MTIAVCCNNPDNGLPDGHVPFIRIGEISFACRYGDWSPRFTEGYVKGSRFIRIGGRKLCTQGQSWSVGNWCWNAYRCHPEDVEALVNWEKFRKWFDVEEAPQKLFEAYKAGRALKLVKAGSK